MSKSRYKTREEWLMEGLGLIRPLFQQIKRPIPAKVRVSCGFPSKMALSAKARRIGECWADKASKGSYFELFISPVLSDPVRVLDVLVHESVHAVVGVEAGHKAPFREVALAVGLTGKMTATVAGEELTERINAIVRKLGPYPHDILEGMVTLPKAKDKCRLLKAECVRCGYVIRVTKKWAEEAGLPICPTCNLSFEMEEPDE